jgi:hypothetical protein
MSTHPTIAVKITTSSSTFDLYHTESLTISLALTLTHRRPITFLKRYTGLFDGKIFHTGGLTFTNTATGHESSRNRIDICYMGARDGISWATKSGYITLYPGQAHTIERDIDPMNSPNKRAAREHWRSRYISFLDMSGLASFEYAQTYEVGVSEEAVVHGWFEGSISEILVWQMLGWTPEEKREVIGYTVVEAASFEVHRFKPDDIAVELEPEPEPVEDCSPKEVPVLVLSPTARVQRHGNENGNAA